MNRYEAIRLLGEGGMGKVYLARQLDLGRQVVVKVMHDHISEELKFKERFQRETFLMARFQHPYAVSLYDASLDDPLGPCIVMEYIRGINLDTLLQKNGRLSPGRVCRILNQLCEVLQAAHSEGMIHRDLKPANLMVTDHDTPREKIKVMDFGLAKLTDEEVWGKVTESNLDFAVGTPGYISPEQVRGEVIDHRSDLYSVGVMLYELLTGRLPFTGATSMDLMLAHATEMPPTFAELELNDVIPGTIEDVVFRCLAKDPNDRQQSAHQLAEEFESALMEDTVPMADVIALSAQETQPLPSVQHRLRPLANEASAMTFQMEAWMPEAIAVMKLRGFVHDFAGTITDSVPGLIRVEMFGARSKKNGSGVFSLFGLSRKNETITMELHLHQLDNTRGNHLLIQVLFHPGYHNQLHDPVWRERCTQTFVELRSYFMGTGSAIVYQ